MNCDALYKSAAAVRSTQRFYCMTRTDSQKPGDDTGFGEINLNKNWKKY